MEELYKELTKLSKKIMDECDWTCTDCPFFVKVGEKTDERGNRQDVDLCQVLLSISKK